MGSDYWGVVTNVDEDKEMRPLNVGEDDSKSDEKERIMEQKKYDKKNNSAHVAILAGVSTDLQRTIASFVGWKESTRLAWKTLKGKYDHETTISTLELFNSLVDLKMEEGDWITDYISNFEATYSHVFSRCSESSKEEARHLKNFLASDSVKTMSFLRTLPHFFENVVDNLMSKDNVTSADVNKRLLDIQSKKSFNRVIPKHIRPMIKNHKKKKEKKKNVLGANQEIKNLKDTYILNVAN